MDTHFETDDKKRCRKYYGTDPAYQNRGYTTEAVQALIAWAFDQPECTSIVADTQKSNLASVRILEKVGMNVYRETDDALYWRINK